MSRRLVSKSTDRVEKGILGAGIAVFLVVLTAQIGLIVAVIYGIVKLVNHFT